jgi:hypothetical protein
MAVVSGVLVRVESSPIYIFLLWFNLQPAPICIVRFQFLPNCSMQRPYPFWVRDKSDSEQLCLHPPACSFSQITPAHSRPTPWVSVYYPSDDAFYLLVFCRFTGSECSLVCCLCHWSSPRTNSQKKKVLRELLLHNFFDVSAFAILPLTFFLFFYAKYISASKVVVDQNLM